MILINISNFMTLCNIFRKHLIHFYKLSKENLIIYIYKKKDTLVKIKKKSI